MSSLVSFPLLLILHPFEQGGEVPCFPRKNFSGLG